MTTTRRNNRRTARRATTHKFTLNIYQLCALFVVAYLLGHGTATFLLSLAFVTSITIAAIAYHRLHHNRCHHNLKR